MSEVRKARSRLANEVRRVGAEGGNRHTHFGVERERKALATAKIDEYVRRVLAEAPPLSPDQLARLASLFGGERR